jgi:serine/threonine-protein kinase
MQEGPSQMVAGVVEGDVIAGKYRIEKVLGAGGMGVVVAARHIQLDEKVALKFLLPEALAHPEAVARFLREARAAVKIKNEHVARVSDVGTLESGVPYMVMEYLDGSDLSAWLEQRGPLPLEQAVEFVLQACVAVADAHALGIVHRDLKPANLFCVRRSDGQLTIKVLDFGISKLTDLRGSGRALEMTKTAALMGSPRYMSPEQMRSSKDVDGGTDIWALGVVLYELIAGRAPFLAETVTELAIQVASDPPPSLRGLRLEAPPELEVVVLKCLEKDRRRRFRNVAELAHALLPFAPERARAFVQRISGIVQMGATPAPDATPASLPAGPHPTSAGTLTLPPVGRTTMGRPRAGKPLAFAGAALGVLAVSAAVTFLVFTRKSPVAEDQRAPASAVTAVSSAPPAVSAAQPPAPVEEKVVDPSAAETAPPRLPPEPATKPVARPSPPAPARTSIPARTAPSPSSAATARPLARPSAQAPANCDPPYYFDARGNRIFKPECL